MSKFFLDSVLLDVTSYPVNTVGQLFSWIEQRCQQEHLCIHECKINGHYVPTQTLSQVIGSRFLKDFQSIEIFTKPITDAEQIQENLFKHPTQLAYESLQDLIAYCPYLRVLAQRAVEAYGMADFLDTFHGLLDGIGLFVEAIQTIKDILRPGMVKELMVLEADLLSILKDLQDYIQSREYFSELLNQHLIKNILDWEQKGLPFLLDFRNC